jgi:pre-mRNA-processing factor 19
MNMATSLEFYTLDVFTGTRFLGNPLAVVLVPAELKSALSQETKQKIAREFNLSETVFLHHDADTTKTSRDINIFTTFSEITFAGHPTIGTAALVLHYLGWSQVTTLVTLAGPISIVPTTAQGYSAGISATIPHAVKIHRRVLKDVLPIHTSDIERGLSSDSTIRDAELDAVPVSIVRGMTFLMVKLDNLEDLAKVGTGSKLNFDKIKPDLLDQGEWMQGFVGRYYYVVVEEPQVNDTQKTWKVRTRMVELESEDPATGSAASALSSYLALGDGGNPGRYRFEIAQGVEMGRHSDILVDLETEAVDGAVQVKDVVLGGQAVVVMKGSIQA